ncbi:signal peptidase I [Pontibacter sp. G13]|uniref:signal peptidase I n=1 Tax=Pontibacter sp. G13 TaxID=3074898 RepID=UPI00288B2A6E|nr:signal peptidase I [Pontibacter sp. G13]WNJ16828.1 signal peptidase I [Pontibacter sp. G13]
MNFAGIFFGIVVFLLFGASAVGRWKLFEKAGQAGWKALIPVYSEYITLQLIGKPIWWLILLFIPVANVLVGVAMQIEFVKSYGKYKLVEHMGALLIPFIYLPKIGFDPATKYLGPPAEHKRVPKKSNLREWGDALLFAGVAAMIIRTCFIEAFMIPTSSMERTLMAGDFLFVSKFHYGTRMPMLPVSLPFLHNKLTIKGKTYPSFTDAIELPYFRLPGLSDVERNDIVVFNFPAHDIQELSDGLGTVSAVSAKENYIKRCVGVAGDTLEIRDQQVFINGEEGWNPPNMQLQYQVVTDNGFFLNKRQRKDLGFREVYVRGNNPANNQNYNISMEGQNLYQFFMPEHIANEVRSMPTVKKVDEVYRQAGKFAPYVYPSYGNSAGKLFKFNEDNYGPIVIPAKGMTVELTPKNLALYYRPITAYEGHKLERKGGKIYIDGEVATTYTFEMDYYWMMGDNRHNSEDSRFWGFVPENHIVGKPIFIFFSYEEAFGVRFDRIGPQKVK